MRDTLMRVRDLDSPSSQEEDVLPVWLIAGGSGAGAASASATMLVVLAVLGWLTGAGGSESAGVTVAAGLAGWAFAHGAPLRLDQGSVGLIPWLLALWPLLCAWWSAQRVVPDPEATSPRLRGFGGVRRDVAVAGAAFVAGYALVAALLAVGAHLGGARPSIAFTAFGALLLAALAYLLALLPTYRGHLDALAPRVAWAWREYVPQWVAAAIRPALRAALLTLALGALTVIVAVAVAFPSVTAVYARIGGGVVGATLLTLAQLAYLPTLSLWGASWLAGPGFTLGGGTSVSWGASEPGIIPLIPVLAAAPPPGPMPAWTPIVVAGPVLVGILLGVWCARRADGTWIGRARLTGVAVALYGIVMLVVAVAASGSVGGGRFAHVGVDAVLTALSLTGEVGLAAFVVVGLAGLRLRRTGAGARDGSEPAASPTTTTSKTTTSPTSTKKAVPKKSEPNKAGPKKNAPKKAEQKNAPKKSEDETPGRRLRPRRSKPSQDD